MENTAIANATINTPAKLNFKNKELTGHAKEIAKIGADMANKNVELGKIFGRIKSTECYKEDGFDSVADFAEKTFGVKKALAYQLAKIGERFYLSDSETAKKVAKLLPPSNLAEVANMTDEEIEKRMNSGEISEKSTQKELREIAKSDKKSSTKVLAQYEIDAKVIHGNAIDSIHWDKTEIETAVSEIVKKYNMANYVEKTFIREGKYDAAYHKGIRIYLDESGDMFKLTYGLAETPVKKKPEKKKYSIEELRKMLAEAEAAGE